MDSFDLATNRVRMHMMHRSTEYVLMLGAFKYQADATRRWMAWLQDRAWQFLARTRALVEAYEQKDKVTTVDFDPTDIFRAVAWARGEVHSRMGQPPMRLVISPESFQKITRQVLQDTDCPWQYMSLDHRTFMGMTVEIVPWMDGWVVLP